jgi:hypothetical protein
LREANQLHRNNLLVQTNGIAIFESACR